MDCLEGFYSSTSGAAVCSECANVYGSEYSSTEGSTLCDTCTKSYYRTLNESCERCPSKGITCDREGTTLANLEIDSSFYRFSNQTAEAYSCPFGKAACLGSGLSNTSTSTHPRGCSQGHTGPLCGVCVRKYFLDRVENMCVDCAATDTEGAFITIAVWCFVLLAVFACCTTKWPTPTPFNRQAERTQVGRRE